MLVIQSVIEPVAKPLPESQIEENKRAGSRIPSLRFGSSARDTAHRILEEVMQFRRIPDPHECSGAHCALCFAPHLPNVISAVEQAKAITFVLPAFPGKSPNLEKVLGPLPDMAERRSLEFLSELCERIRKIYTPGASIIICSDGRVFSDVVGMLEDDVSDYQQELLQMIADLSLTSIRTFNLEDVFSYQDFAQMRLSLMERYGASLLELRQSIRKGGEPGANPEEVEATRMYRGITRFLFEDSLFEGQTKSRTTLQKEARIKAYEVIRRSNAWSELIADSIPHAVRLSIHPQVCGSKKLGVRLIGNECWMTPWHGVAVETNHGFTLLKRSEAEALGAQLVYFLDGRPSHYQLPGTFVKGES